MGFVRDGLCGMDVVLYLAYGAHLRLFSPSQDIVPEVHDCRGANFVLLVLEDLGQIFEGARLSSIWDDVLIRDVQRACRLAAAPVRLPGLEAFRRVPIFEWRDPLFGVRGALAC